MTVLKAYNLHCDHDECSTDGVPAGAFDLDQWPKWQSAAEVRAAAKRAGWTRNRDGKDLCPDHSA